MLSQNSNLSAAFFVDITCISRKQAFLCGYLLEQMWQDAERFGIFVGLWAPTLMGLANYYRE